MLATIYSQGSLPFWYHSVLLSHNFYSHWFIHKNAYSRDFDLFNPTTSFNQNCDFPKTIHFSSRISFYKTTHLIEIIYFGSTVHLISISSVTVTSHFIAHTNLTSTNHYTRTILLTQVSQNQNHLIHMRRLVHPK